MPGAPDEPDLAIEPLTPERWPDLEDLFGPERGACAGCWCTWPLLPRRQFLAMSKADRRSHFRAVVEAGPAPGLLAYDQGMAVGWCAVAPRQAAIRFDTARPSRPAKEGEDPSRIFAITCFYVRAGRRGAGLTHRLARAAVAHALARGARAVEACPIDTGRKLAWGEGFVGFPGVFERLGFREIARRSPTRPLLRLDAATGGRG
jgi:GNAT superfamily N-acetyltransferase